MLEDWTYLDKNGVYQTVHVPFTEKTRALYERHASETVIRIILNEHHFEGFVSHYHTRDRGDFEIYRAVGDLDFNPKKKPLYIVQKGHVVFYSVGESDVMNHIYRLKYNLANPFNRIMKK